VNFNVPNLFFLPGSKGVHIARTNIAGCTTECGVTLEAGQNFIREPMLKERFCTRCYDSITHLGTVGGSRKPPGTGESDRERQAAIILATALACGGYDKQHAHWLTDAVEWLNARTGT
jgi:hypothetical protein